MPPAFSHRIVEDQNSHAMSCSNSGAIVGTATSGLSLASETLNQGDRGTVDRDAAVNRQVRLVFFHAKHHVDYSISGQVASAVSEIRCTVGEMFEEKAKHKGFVWLGRLAKKDTRVMMKSSNTSISHENSSSSYISSGGGATVPDNLRSPRGGAAGVGDSDSLQPFTLEAYDYDTFVNRMRLPEAQPLREQTRAFVNGILNRARVVLQGIKGEVSNFVWSMGQQLLQHPLWAGSSESDVLECLERYVCLRLHDRAFASDPSSRQNDALLHLRVSALSFITPAHLDIHPSRRCASSWAQAQAALRHMHDCITPREMLEDVLECAKCIYALNPDDCGHEPEPLSADEYLPILIYQVLQSGLPQLQSIIDYISALRHPDLMSSECQYFFTHFVGAVFFIESLDASQLSIDPAVFQQLMRLAEDTEVAGIRDRVPSMGLFSPAKMKAVAVTAATIDSTSVEEPTNQQQQQQPQSSSSTPCIPSRRTSRRDTLQPQDAQAIAAIAAAAMAEAAIPSIPEEGLENDGQTAADSRFMLRSNRDLSTGVTIGDAIGGDIMFKEIQEQLHVSPSNSCFPICSFSD
jgi:hypothetical protein